MIDSDSPAQILKQLHAICCMQFVACYKLHATNCTCNHGLSPIAACTYRPTFTCTHYLSPRDDTFYGAPLCKRPVDLSAFPSGSAGCKSRWCHFFQFSPHFRLIRMAHSAFSLRWCSFLFYITSEISTHPKLTSQRQPLLHYYITKNYTKIFFT